MADKVDKIMALIVPGINGWFEHYWKAPLIKNCNEMIWVDLKDYNERYGSAKTIESIKSLFYQKKPDYLFICDGLYYDIDMVGLLMELREISPKTKSVFISGDDDLMFESTRYLARYFDYVLTAQMQYIKKFKEDGLRNILPIDMIMPVPPTEIKHKKIYPITFIGGPKADRKMIIEEVYKKHFDIKVFGVSEWKDSPIIKKIHGGFLPPEDYIKTIRQTKINLCFSKNSIGVSHLKGRFFENSLCKTFSLVEYCPFLAQLFKEDKEIVFFRSEKELLEKVEYYLEHEQERERIAGAAYKKTKEKFDFEKVLGGFIAKTKDNTSHRDMPSYTTNILNLQEKYMKLPKNQLFQILESYEYVSFEKGKSIPSKLKNNLQIYSLKTTGKEVSCCNYFIYSKILGNYSSFSLAPGIEFPEADYYKFLNINQFFMTKKFFIDNFEKIRKEYFSEKITFSNKKNTAFVSVPLVKIITFRKDFFDEEFDKTSEMFFNHYFPRRLHSLRRHPAKFMVFLYGLFLEIISGKKFIFTQLRKKYIEKIKTLK